MEKDSSVPRVPSKHNTSRHLILTLIVALTTLVAVIVYTFSGHLQTQYLSILDTMLSRKFNVYRPDDVRDLKLTDDEKNHLLKLGLTPNDPFIVENTSDGSKKTIHGRFLHITDIHPDAFYKEGTSIDNVCHSNKPDRKKDFAPYFGAPKSGCDSPMELMEYTLKWVADNLKNKIDFVIWTGDNIRHDNDRYHPRNEFQIFDMNELVSGKFHDIFKNQNSKNPRDFDVHVIPSLGNNDVFPHNLFSLGPTLQTREFFKIWNTYIPEEQQHIFNKVASFFVEVIPGKLAVLSINTLYLYKANPLVDNCNSPKTPGYQLLLWLGYVLEELRARGMKVILSGHVPPIPKNYENSCYHKYNLWTYEYRDIIITGLYGHMNMDHFIPLNGKKSRNIIDSTDFIALANEQISASYFGNKETMEDIDNDSILGHAIEASELRSYGARPVNKEQYMRKIKRLYYQKISDRLDDILKVNDFTSEKNKTGKKKKKGGKKKKQPSLDKFAERYNIVNIAGSVIPTFNPSFRVWEYNTTELRETQPSFKAKSWNHFFKTLQVKLEEDLKKFESFQNSKDLYNALARKKVDKSIPEPKPSNLPLGPAHVSQLFSLTKFVQYYADLEVINKNYYDLLDNNSSEKEAAEKSFLYEVEYTSTDEPYHVDTLLVKDYLNIIRELVKDNDLWKSFKKRAFISSGYEDD
ncbi:hypothetical protein TPHA_0K00350 [Tetrapisispora phaffii CBS 4417]|uniref:Endopolyphosphatase n=1 Tax=Tetrapisispora phaffii (strain ATCC 24235 / CBS 4417 / NBRC 1672 / NRRL Y-8282 / UCD 70-5) TaxID=1071381 RepID=G8BZ41_TETPH|nr:hypothetical protein TPHA_0K00350 [Tetrapisispora phaffii CBS 4417]CCE65169.1 hypothetical protein TPHA_0K00350 [Tetrapisispora phaffii CBS 4417]